MKKWMVLFVIVLLTVIVSAEDMCSDTDGGGSKSSDSSSLEAKGDVKYGITTMSDTCLTSENGVSAGSGIYLKEYFCDDDRRRSKVYDCVSLGYVECKDGECVSAGSGNTTATTTTTPITVDDHCGNKIVEKDKGENCDPPNSICFGRTTAQYGLCQDDCTCKIAASAEPAPEVCGDEYLDEGEECEEDSDCPDDYVCSSCSCVKVLTEEEIAAMSKKEDKGVKEDIAKEIEEKYKVSEPPEVDLDAKNFTEEPGIKATSGVAGFFKKIWSWFVGLFS